MADFGGFILSGIVLPQILHLNYSCVPSVASGRAERSLHPPPLTFNQKLHPPPLTLHEGLVSRSRLHHWPDGDYTISGSKTFTITAKTVSTPTVMLEKTYYFYDGTAKTPTVTMKDGETVIPAEEYTVGYSNNTNVGTATVTITDKDGGNYTVSGSATFEIGLKGDANGDNKVDAADIVEMVNETKGQTSAKFKKNNADIDGNGQGRDRRHRERHHAEVKQKSTNDMKRL